MACGRLKSESHCVHRSVILPFVSTTTRRSSPARVYTDPVFSILIGILGKVARTPPGKLATGPWEALRKGASPTGKERLGPTSGRSLAAGRSDVKPLRSPSLSSGSRLSLHRIFFVGEQKAAYKSAGNGRKGKRTIEHRPPFVPVTYSEPPCRAMAEDRNGRG